MVESAGSSSSFLHNEWSIYLISFLALISLFFVQKYAYLIDRKLNQFLDAASSWEGKPWALLSAIFLGALTMIFRVVSPNEMQQNPVYWNWPEWTLILCFFVLFGLLAFESISHFGVRIGMLRLLIFTLLATVFYVAGFLAGLLIIAMVAFGSLIYFIRYWRKLMVGK